MSILDTKKLQNRIFLGYTVPIAIMVLVGTITGVSVINLKSLSNDVARTNKVLIGVQQTDLALNRMVRNVRGQALFPADPTYRDAYNEGQQNFKDIIDEVESDIKDPQQKENWSNFHNEAENIAKLSDDIVALFSQGKVKDAINKTQDLRMVDLAKLYDKIRDRQEEIIGDIEKKQGTAEMVVATSLILGTIIAAVGTLILAIWISKAATGQIRKSAHEITTASSEIATTMEEQERTANQQAASVNETTTTMDELGASSRTSEEQAESAAKAAQEVLELARRGNQAVAETVASMMDLRGKVAAIADQTVRLSEQTNLIGNISELVSDLAQQTNMLALNASVEAVRAGEHGQGFAIVAEEIRKLADQSKQSAGKISSLVSDIQNAINTTVMVTDEGTKTVNAGMNVTERTAQAFSGVVEAVNNVAMNSQQIALNIRQQSRAVQQVLAAMDSINQGAQQSATGITQIKTGTHQLNKTAIELQEIV
ncbi:methyl-accepting chemotaxis protein [Gloeothece verrucosa]|uniref:Methyl-accepting chemotaxis sensory transducer n=1 Tax=Gloeothece verrucosa (strain PCC 7822) TaxID=497965 RepID=E0UB19_GLOV7|nr:methyl-accepting chemotaxis protein [Gloeothece verrucosa]ADN16264.1 methyl-accepting chemotaxis sensory transducer [Gloeothece verrucosa PCC 7822]